MATKKNCGSCAKQNTCPKAKHIENYRMSGSCIDHQWPDETMTCPSRGSHLEMGDIDNHKMED